MASLRGCGRPGATDMDSTLALALLIGLAGGLVRGTTCFGAAMAMSQALALLIGAKAAVPVTLLLETFAALPMLPSAWALARARVLVPISSAALAMVPVGSWLLAGADAKFMRSLIAGTVIVFSLALLSGRRYQGRQRTTTAAALGALSGTMLGATGIGGPPVILYLLSGPDPAAVTRANLSMYLMIISALGLVMLGLNGLLVAETLRIAAWMSPPFVLGLYLGSKLFARFSDQRFRQFTIGLMLLVALGVFIA